MEIFKLVVLSLSGLLLLSVGLMRLLNPVKAYLKNSGITLNQDADLLNEMRGVSAVMLFGGITIALGIFLSDFTFTSHVTAVLLFLGFAFGRMVSVAKDGTPNKQIVQGIIFELIFGMLSAYFMFTS